MSLKAFMIAKNEDKHTDAHTYVSVHMGEITIHLLTVPSSSYTLLRSNCWSSFVYIYTHIYILTHAHKCVFIYVCMCVYIYVYICMCVYIYVYICVYIENMEKEYL